MQTEFAHAQAQRYLAQRNRLAALAAELTGLELAAKLRPSATPGANVVAVQPQAKDPGKKGGGRRAGDISHDWRAVLRALYVDNKPRSYEEIAAVAAANGKPDLAPSSIRDRVRNWTETSLMSGAPNTGFTVTEAAAVRFEFTKENDPPSGGSLAEGQTSVEVSARGDDGDPHGLFS